MAVGLSVGSVIKSSLSEKKKEIFFPSLLSASPSACQRFESHSFLFLCSPMILFTKKQEAFNERISSLIFFFFFFLEKKRNQNEIS